MSGIVYCKFMNYNYIHTPITSVEHSQNPESLNLFIRIPILPSSNKINIDMVKQYENKVHSCNEPSKYCTCCAINILQKYYYSTPKPIIENIDISIHIRRGDVDEKILKRYTNNSFYKIIKFFNERYPNRNIIIFSEGIYNDFNDIKGNNISFKLNLNVTEIFHSLISAKILITAKSGFSYGTSTLNLNKIYYINLWHEPLNH